MRRLLVTASLALTLLAGTARAQEPPPPPPSHMKTENPDRADQKKELRRRIQAMRLARLTQELDLDEATAAKVFPLVNRHDEKVSALMEDRAKAIKELAGAVDANKEDAVGPLLDKLDAIEKGVHEADETTHKKLREALTPMQSAKFVLFHEKFEGEIREMLGDAHKDDIVRAKKMAEAKAQEMNTREMAEGAKGKAVLEKAAALLKKGAPLDAAKLATLSLEADPTNVGAYMIRAQAHAQMAELDAALEDAERALALDPGSPDAHALRAHIRLARNDVAGARNDASWLMENFSDQPLGWALEGMARLQSKEFAEAETALTRAIKIRKDPTFFRLRGDARAHLGKPADAIEDYKRFLDAAPDSPETGMVKKKIAELEPK